MSARLRQVVEFGGLADYAKSYENGPGSIFDYPGDIGGADAFFAGLVACTYRIGDSWTEDIAST